MEEGEDAIQEEVTFEELPPHKQKLYSLFGQEEAEYYLRPRIEPERKKVVHVPRAIKQLGGRAGADALWDTLRERSQVKLQYADWRIPLELKDAYGAFVRECLTKNETVAKRSFYSETEVPDNEKLQDNSYRERVKDIQRRMELMYRAAQANEDKTGVLLYNNPIPDFNNFEGHEGPLRYLPSWIQVEDEDDRDETGEPSYKKWLPSASQMERMQHLHLAENSASDDGDLDQGDNDLEGGGDHDSNDFGQLLASRSVSSQSLPELGLGDDEEADDPGRPHPLHHRPAREETGNAPRGGAGQRVDPTAGARRDRRQRLLFLTEKDATCEGHFMENLAAKDTSRDLATGADVMGAATQQGSTPRVQSGARGKTKLRSHTAPATVGMATSASLLAAASTSPGDGRTGKRKSRHAPTSTSTSKGPTWEPLTMNALNDHQPAIQLFGGADFAHGREFMWKPVLSTAPKGT